MTMNNGLDRNKIDWKSLEPKERARMARKFLPPNAKTAEYKLAKATNHLEVAYNRYIRPKMERIAKIKKGIAERDRRAAAAALALQESLATRPNPAQVVQPISTANSLEERLAFLEKELGIVRG